MSFIFVQPTIQKRPQNIQIWEGGISYFKNDTSVMKIIPKSSSRLTNQL